MRRWCLSVAVAGAASAGIHAQVPVFRSGVDAVRVDVSVMRGTRPVRGLATENFTLTDNGVAQDIDSVTVDTVPLNIMLVLDSSGSMLGDRMTHLVDGARALVQSLKPADSAALIIFADSVELAVPMTGDRAALLKALAGLQAFGATSLHDAMFLALQMRPQTMTDARPVLLAFSDGRDTTSWLPPDKLVEATRRSGVVTHVIELMPRGFRDRGSSAASEVLNDVAAAGGGRRWPAADPSDLRDLFTKVLEELRSRYLLTYFPTNTARDGWHDVKVRLKGARGEVIARPGYFVAPPE